MTYQLTLHLTYIYPMMSKITSENPSQVEGKLDKEASSKNEEKNVQEKATAKSVGDKKETSLPQTNNKQLAYKKTKNPKLAQ